MGRRQPLRRALARERASLFEPRGGTLALVMRWLDRLLDRSGHTNGATTSLVEAPADSQFLREALERLLLASGGQLVCSRCRRALRRNPHQVRAGRARAARARRDELGRFL